MEAVRIKTGNISDTEIIFPCRSFKEFIRISLFTSLSAE
jgi:hypothetical protein